MTRCRNPTGRRLFCARRFFVDDAYIEALPANKFWRLFNTTPDWVYYETLQGFLFFRGSSVRNAE